MIKRNKKIGANRGNPRLWIEGKMLLDADWVRGARFGVEYHDNGVTIVRDGDGGHAVAGTEARPIIDINNNKLPSVGVYTMVIGPNEITLRAE